LSSDFSATEARARCTRRGTRSYPSRLRSRRSFTRGAPTRQSSNSSSRACWRARCGIRTCAVYDLFATAKGAMRCGSSMELLNGSTLADRLSRHGPLPLAEALPLVEQMASGLGAAHEVGVVHRDFKPANVMLVERDGGEQAVVTDFGTARAAAGASVEGTSGDSRLVAGTPAYMAPEQGAARSRLGGGRLRDGRRTLRDVTVLQPRDTAESAPPLTKTDCRRASSAPTSTTLGGGDPALPGARAVALRALRTWPRRWGVRRRPGHAWGTEPAAAHAARRARSFRRAGGRRGGWRNSPPDLGW
jgi:hypothetical protein